METSHGYGNSGILKRHASSTATTPKRHCYRAWPSSDDVHCCATELGHHPKSVTATEHGHDHGCLRSVPFLLGGLWDVMLRVLVSRCVRRTTLKIHHHVYMRHCFGYPCTLSLLPKPPIPGLLGYLKGRSVFRAFLNLAQ